MNWAAAAMPHLVVVPVMLPFVAGAVMLLLGASRRSQAVLGIAASVASLLVSLGLLDWVVSQQAPAAFGIYLPSNWDVPHGIVLVADRLSAVLLVLTATISVACVVYATARWDRASVHFHCLFQFQLMGLNGAFLTADLFNLFVFFEIMLAASYGLLLHGSGRKRVRAGLHYIAVNLVASSLFLVGVAILYGITGTLNMADMAQKIPQVPPGDRGLLHAGAAILAIAFLTKAAMWPLNFWLAPAYSSAVAPVAAVFVLLTKLGLYAVLRTWTLLLWGEAGTASPFGSDLLVYGGIATLAAGTIGMLASQQPRRLAACSVVVSAGTLLAAVGFASAPLVAGALFYLLVSTLSASALYLLAELVERSRERRPKAIVDDEDDDEDVEDALPQTRYVGGSRRTHAAPALQDEAQPVGKAIPGTMVLLSLGFTACALLVAGLPPLPGFLAKFAMLTALVDFQAGAQAGKPFAVAVAGWTFLVLLLGSSVLATVAFSRSGVRYFWAPQDRPTPIVTWSEGLPIAALLLITVVMAVRAEPVMRLATTTAEGLMRPEPYVTAVMSARPVPNPVRVPPAPTAGMSR